MTSAPTSAPTCTRAGKPMQNAYVARHARPVRQTAPEWPRSDSNARPIMGTGLMFPAQTLTMERENQDNASRALRCRICLRRAGRARWPIRSDHDFPRLAQPPPLG